MGYIKLDRKIMNSFLWNDKPFNKATAWIDLLLLATWKDSKEMYRGELVQRKAGEVSCSIEWLASRWGWDRKKVMRFLNVLEDEQMVSQKRTRRGTTLSIVNWAKYQTDGTTNGTTDGTTDGTSDGTTDGTHYKKVKKDKKERNIIPPSRELVYAYADERAAQGKPRVDPESFCDFYDSKGWLVGKVKMKDWQAAWRNWEKTTKPTQKTFAQLAFEQEEEWKRNHGKA